MPASSWDTGAPVPSPERGARLRAALSGAARVSGELLLVAAGVVALGYLVGRLWSVLLPVVFALLLTTVLWPVARFLQEHGWRPAWSALVGVLLFLAALTGVVLLVVPPLVQQSAAVTDGVVRGLQEVRQWLTGPPLDLREDQIGQAVDRAIAVARENLQGVAGVVLSALTSLGTGLANAVIALVVTFFFLKDGSRWLPWLGAQTTLRVAPHLVEVSGRCWGALSAFIRSQALIGLVDAVFIGIGLFVLDVPLLLPLTVLIFVGAFVPIVGAFVAGGVAVLIALVTHGPSTAAAVLGVVLVVQAIEGNVLQPVIQGPGLGLHPGVVVLAVSAGGTFQGILGTLLGVPAAALVAVVYRYVRDLLDGRDPTAGGGTDTEGGSVATGGSGG